MLRLKVDLWKSSMDVQAYLIDTVGKRHDLLMTFDTGAYMTVIDSFVLSQAGYVTASGNDTIVDTIGHRGIPAKEVLLHGLELEDINGARTPLGPVLVYAIDMSDTFTVGVLGLNVIREFITEIKFGDPTVIDLDPNFNINEHVKFDDFNFYTSRFGLW